MGRVTSLTIHRSCKLSDGNYGSKEAGAGVIVELDEGDDPQVVYNEWAAWCKRQVMPRKSTADRVEEYEAEKRRNNLESSGQDY